MLPKKMLLAPGLDELVPKMCTPVELKLHPLIQSVLSITISEMGTKLAVLCKCTQRCQPA